MSRFFVFMVVLSYLTFTSSANAQQKGNAPLKTNQQKKSGPAVVAHLHPTHGPHEGELIELGNEEYHAELIVDEVKKQMTIYLLDKEAKSYIAIDAPSLSVNFHAKGKPVQVKMKPSPQEVDQKGLSSCFGIVSPELFSALHDSKSDAKLSLKIGKKAYVAKIVHSHDHSGHAHSSQAPGSTIKK